MSSEVKEKVEVMKPLDKFIIMDAIPVLSENKVKNKVIRALSIAVIFLSLVAILLIDHFVHAKYVLPITVGVGACLCFLSVALIKANSKIQIVRNELEFQFYEECFALYHPVKILSINPKSAIKVIDVIYYKDLLPCTYNPKTSNHRMAARRVERTTYKFTSDGDLIESSEKHRVLKDKVVMFNTKYSDGVGVRKNIREMSKSKINFVKLEK